MSQRRPAGAARAVATWGSVALMCGACSPVYSRVSTEPPGPSSSVPHAQGERGVPPELATVLSTLVWPLAMDRVSVLSSSYGVRDHPTGGDGRFHRGLDLRAPEGTPIYAVADGRVVQSGPGGAYGNLVLIDHGADLRSLYAHHRENLVGEGERVGRGQVIALVGHTGNATGDHLHFELRWRNGTVDPRTVLPPLSEPSGR